MTAGRTKTVYIQYYAILREQRGCSSETVETLAGTVGELYAELHGRYGFSLGAPSMRAAVNAELQPWDRPLRDGDTVVFVPPVAGG